MNCPSCNALVVIKGDGHVIQPHFVRTTDVRPCPGSFKAAAVPVASAESVQAPIGTPVAAAPQAQADAPVSIEGETGWHETAAKLSRATADFQRQVMTISIDDANWDFALSVWACCEVAIERFDKARCSVMSKWNTPVPADGYERAVSRNNAKEMREIAEALLAERGLSDDRHARQARRHVIGWTDEFQNNMVTITDPAVTSRFGL